VPAVVARLLRVRTLLPMLISRLVAGVGMFVLVLLLVFVLVLVALAVRKSAGPESKRQDGDGGDDAKSCHAYSL